MKAISVRQPHAWLLFHGKDIENRTWYTNFRGEILIHASQTIDHSAMGEYMHGVRIPPRRVLQLGGIIGKVTIVDCVRESDSLWFQGPFGFVIKNARPLKFRKCKGRLGFFEIEGR